MKKLSNFIGIAAMLIATILIGCAPVADGGNVAGGSPSNVTPPRGGAVPGDNNSTLNMPKDLLSVAISGEWRRGPASLTLYPNGTGIYLSGLSSIRVATPVTLDDLGGEETFTWTLEAEKQLSLTMTTDGENDGRYLSLIFDWEKPNEQPQIYESNKSDSPFIQDLKNDPAVKAIGDTSKIMRTVLGFAPISGGGTAADAKPALTFIPADVGYTAADRLAILRDRGLTAINGKTKIPVRYNTTSTTMKTIDVWMLDLATGNIEEHSDATYRTMYEDIDNRKVPTGIEIVMPKKPNEQDNETTLLALYDARNTNDYGNTADTTNRKKIPGTDDTTGASQNEAWDGYSKDLVIELFAPDSGTTATKPLKVPTDASAEKAGETSQVRYIPTPISGEMQKLVDDPLNTNRFDWWKVESVVKPATTETGQPGEIFVKKYYSSPSVEDVQSLITTTEQKQVADPAMVISNVSFYESLDYIGVAVDMLKSAKDTTAADIIKYYGKVTGATSNSEGEVDEVKVDFTLSDAPFAADLKSITLSSAAFTTFANEKPLTAGPTAASLATGDVGKYKVMDVKYNNEKRLPVLTDVSVRVKGDTQVPAGKALANVTDVTDAVKGGLMFFDGDKNITACIDASKVIVTALDYPTTGAPAAGDKLNVTVEFEDGVLNTEGKKYYTLPTLDGSDKLFCGILQVTLVAVP